MDGYIGSVVKDGDTLILRIFKRDTGFVEEVRIPILAEVNHG